MAVYSRAVLICNGRGCSETVRVLITHDGALLGTCVDAEYQELVAQWTFDISPDQSFAAGRHYCKRCVKLDADGRVVVP